MAIENNNIKKILLYFSNIQRKELVSAFSVRSLFIIFRVKLPNGGFNDDQ